MSVGHHLSGSSSNSISSSDRRCVRDPEAWAGTRATRATADEKRRYGHRLVTKTVAAHTLNPQTIRWDTALECSLRSNSLYA